MVVSLETKLVPTRPKGYGLKVHMHHFRIFDDYHWRDSGTISINMICKGDEFLDFLRYLKVDLDALLLGVPNDDRTESDTTKS